MSTSGSTSANLARKKSLLTIFVIVIIMFLIVLHKASYTLAGEADSYEKEADLTVPVLYENRIPDDFEMVAEAAENLIWDNIHVHVDLQAILYNRNGNTINQSELKVLKSSGIKFDVFPDILSYGDYRELDDLLASEGKDILTIIDNDRIRYEKLKSGKIYAIPSVSDYVSSFGITMRKDLLDERGIKTSNIHTFKDLSSVYDAVSAKNPSMYMVCGYSSASGFIGRLKRKYIDAGKIGTLGENITDNSIISNYYASESYRELLKLFHQWWEGGYLPPDMMFQDTQASQLVSAGVLFSYFSAYKPSIEYEESISCGYDMVTVSLTDPAVTSNSLDSCVHWGISTECNYPHEAMRFLNYLYTDEHLMNLLLYGIEGIHYEKVSDNVIRYPEGITRQNVGYIYTQPWIFPNQFLSYIWDGYDVSIWDKTRQYNTEAPWRESVFFNFDTGNISEELSSVDEVLDKYSIGLESGIADPDVYLDKMLEELKNAGSNNIIAEANNQYSLWKNTYSK